MDLHIEKRLNYSANDLNFLLDFFSAYPTHAKAGLVLRESVGLIDALGGYLYGTPISSDRFKRFCRKVLHLNQLEAVVLYQVRCAFSHMCFPAEVGVCFDDQVPSTFFVFKNKVYVNSLHLARNVLEKVTDRRFCNKLSFKPPFKNSPNNRTVINHVKQCDNAKKSVAKLLASKKVFKYSGNIQSSSDGWGLTGPILIP